MNHLQVTASKAPPLMPSHPLRRLWTAEIAGLALTPISIRGILAQYLPERAPAQAGKR